MRPILCCRTKSLFWIWISLSAVFLGACKNDTISSLDSVVVTQQAHLMGRGNDYEVLMEAKIFCDTSSDAPILKGLIVNLDGTTSLSDLNDLSVYVGTDQYRKDSVECIGTAQPKKGDFKIQTNYALRSDENNLLIACSVSETAPEGNLVDLSLLSIETNKGTYKVENASPEGNMEIVRCRSLVYSLGDYGSKYYRIPCVVKSTDSTLLTLTDKRKFNDVDLPQDIDLVSCISADGGRTWSKPFTVAKGLGLDAGFGDAAVVPLQEAGCLLAVFVGGHGLWASTAADPIRSYQSLSKDGGRTWSEPVDITDFIFGKDCHDTKRSTWLASFFGSGNGLRCSSGRIMFVAAVRETGNWSLNNYLVYSDDEGQTWQVSERASVGGDEAKVVELNDGSILMSIRHKGERWFNVSHDQGVTWMDTVSAWPDLVGSACNGDIIRYQADGKDCLLHSLPFGESREGVRVYASFDQGRSWPWENSKCIVPGASAYSSLCMTPDGNIGIYVEEGENGYRMMFYSFSLDWLTRNVESPKNQD